MSGFVSSDALQIYVAEALALAKEAQGDGCVALAREYGRIAEALAARVTRVSSDQADLVAANLP
ncbi:MAG: hypothetical protein ACTSX7_16635 [Alphaproteobacteria bacterium]